MKEIIKDCEKNNWAHAIRRFKKLDMANKEFESMLKDLTKKELKLIAMLGYYARG